MTSILSRATSLWAPSFGGVRTGVEGSPAWTYKDNMPKTFPIHGHFGMESVADPSDSANRHSFKRRFIGEGPLIRALFAI